MRRVASIPRIAAPIAVAAACLAASARGGDAEPAASPADAFADRLTAVELALSTIVAEQPNLWRFDALEAEAAALLVEASTEAERNEVRTLADRIDRFAAIGQRYRVARGAPPMADLAKTRSTPPPTVAKPKAKGEYDAVGVLRPVVSKRPNAPSYALVGPDGRVTTLLTPSAELDLKPLVGKRVGIRGKRGFIPEFRRNYVAASGATVLR